MEKPFQKGAPGPVWAPAGLEEARPGLTAGQEPSRTWSWQPVLCWVGIQVQQESFQDQETGAWKIPLIYSVLVSPSGVFSVYLFSSKSMEGPDHHHGAGLAQGRNGAFVLSLLQNISNCPALGRLGDPFPCRKSHFSRTSHPWEPGVPT